MDAALRLSLDSASASLQSAVLGDALLAGAGGQAAVEGLAQGVRDPAVAAGALLTALPRLANNADVEQVHSAHLQLIMLMHRY